MSGGEPLGDEEGEAVGCALGALVGEMLGETLGETVGAVVGANSSVASTEAKPKPGTSSDTWAPACAMPHHSRATTCVAECELSGSSSLASVTVGGALPPSPVPVRVNLPSLSRAPTTRGVSASSHAYSHTSLGAGSGK